MSFRTRILNTLFGSLYGPLELLHEPAGRFVFGPSWAGRRTGIAEALAGDGLAIDLGCGGGLLLSQLTTRDGTNVGIDLSAAMTLRARKRGCDVVQGDARTLPVSTGSVSAIVCTYPGSWILDPTVWNELARISRPGAPVIVLIGGTVTRGQFSTLRGALIRVAYGPGLGWDTPVIQGLGNDLVTGSVHRETDQWGEVLTWKGTRRR